MMVNRGEYGAAPECKGGGNGRTLRKPTDLRHQPARFPPYTAQGYSVFVAVTRHCAVVFREVEFRWSQTRVECEPRHCNTTNFAMSPINTFPPPTYVLHSHYPAPVYVYKLSTTGWTQHLGVKVRCHTSVALIRVTPHNYTKVLCPSRHTGAFQPQLREKKERYRERERERERTCLRSAFCCFTYLRAQEVAYHEYKPTMENLAHGRLRQSLLIARNTEADSITAFRREVTYIDGSHAAPAALFQTSADKPRGETHATRVGCATLAPAPPTKTNRVQSPAGSPDFRKWESYRTAAVRRVFSRISRFPVPSFWRRTIFTSITLIGSQDLAVKSRPNLFIHSTCDTET
ncbi:hypothetical protein PR048_022705, partial [Dryococelus australis]